MFRLFFLWLAVYSRWSFSNIYVFEHVLIPIGFREDLGTAISRSHDPSNFISLAGGEKATGDKRGLPVKGAMGVFFSERNPQQLHSGKLP